jgi:hypothetical protein
MIGIDGVCDRGGRGEAGNGKHSVKGGVFHFLRGTGVYVSGAIGLIEARRKRVYWIEPGIS